MRHDKVRVMKADSLLKSKVGSGSFKQENIKKSQKLVNSLDLDFTPLAHLNLELLESILNTVEHNKDYSSKKKEELVLPIMQIKANATMLSYPNVGKLASVTLDLLESANTLDKNIIEIVIAFRDCAHFMVSKKTPTSISPNDQALIKELVQACDRYYKLKNKNA